jgi:hypothetical protein
MRTGSLMIRHKQLTFSAGRWLRPVLDQWVLDQWARRPRHPAYRLEDGADH